jgi:hypothetical protein
MRFRHISGKDRVDLTWRLQASTEEKINLEAVLSLIALMML